MGVSFGGTAYVSYSRRDEAAHRVVTQLQEAFKDEWVDLKVDINEVRVRESFDEFIKEIGDADCVIVIFSENYFSSFYCMLELANALKKGDTVKRIFPVFADQTYRFDGSKEHWIRHWEAVKNDWHGENPPNEPEKVFGSLAECELILQQLGANFPDSLCGSNFFDDFARRVAATIPACNESLVDWVKETYFHRISNSPNFDDARIYLGRCSEYVRSTLRIKIPQDIPDNDQIAYLIKIAIPDMFDIFFKMNKEVAKEHLPEDQIRQYQHELATLLNKLLPALFSPAALPQLRETCDCEEIGIIEIPHATRVSAELLMAGVDEREASFIVRESLNKRQLYPGRYNLRLPPEGGSSSPTQDIDDDLSNQLGQKSVEVNKVLSRCDQYLFQGVAEPEPNTDYTPEQSKILTQDALADKRELEEPRLYWILSISREVSQERWDKIIRHIQAYYPQIVLLSLAGDFDQERTEKKFFTKLKHIIPTNNPTSTNP